MRNNGLESACHRHWSTIRASALNHPVTGRVPKASAKHIGRLGILERGYRGPVRRTQALAIRCISLLLLMMDANGEKETLEPRL